MGKILLEGIEFFAYHGCYKEEQIIGTRFTIDLEVESDTSKAEVTDDLHDTISYVHIYQAIKEEMNQKSHLIEHVARRILDSLAQKFPAITSMQLKISKLNPPMGGKMKHVAYQTQWDRKQ